MEKQEACVVLQQCLAQLRALPRCAQDSDPFTRWRVRTSTALEALLGTGSAQLRQFCSLVYWPDLAEAEESIHDHAWADGSAQACALLQGVLTTSCP